MQRAHVVQPVRQLHQQDADVLRHGDDQLAEILRLARDIRLRLQLEARELGHAIHKSCDLRPEQPFDLFERGERVLDRVVQQSCDDRRAVEPVLGENAGDFDGMREIRVARGALLRAVHLHRKDVGAVERVLVYVGIVGADTFDQFVLPDHGALPARPRPGPARQRDRSAMKRGRARPHSSSPAAGSAPSAASSGPSTIASSSTPSVEAS